MIGSVGRSCRLFEGCRGGSRLRATVAALALAGLIVLYAPAAAADPWLAPGNIQTRQDIELLADSGVIHMPMTTWPIPWGSLAAQLAVVRTDRLSEAQQVAYERLVEDIRGVQAGGSHLGDMVKAAPGRPALHWFGDSTRGKSAAGASFAGYNGNLAFRLNVSAVYGSRDHQRARFDGSYLSVALDNWILTAGQINQFWGPAWSGSLILGTNARPVPGIMLSRNVSTPFQTPILHWLGPWTFTMFAGKLGEDRYIPHPFLLGARLAFDPLNGLEVGFSRTAQFGGRGRPQGLNCLWKTIAGQTNVQPGTTVDCAGQMAGFDVRFHIPDTRLALYSQFNATDSSHFGLSKWTTLSGLSMWGTVGRYGANYRAFLEYANTTVNAYKTPVINTEYENHIYKSGYNYRGVVMGYPTGNDSELWTLGLTLQGTDNGELTFLLRHGALNKDNSNVNLPWGGNKLAPVRTSLNEMDVYYTPSFWHRHLSFELGVTRWGPYGLPVETGIHAQIGWQTGFSE